MSSRRQDHRTHPRHRREQQDEAQEARVGELEELILDEPEPDPRRAGPGAGLAPSYDMLAVEHALVRIKRYLARHGVATANEEQARIDELLAGGEWVNEPLPETATPVERAQEIMYGARALDDIDERLAMAEGALEISRDCADAWVMIADLAESSLDARKAYKRGIDAGKRALGGTAPTEPVDNYWDLLPAWPWIRARRGLASVFRSQGEQDKAIAIYRDLLRIDPHDFANVRMPMSATLMEARAFDEHLALIDQFTPDGHVYWPWTKALVRFQQQGDSELAVSALDEARARNAWVPFYLLGARRLGTGVLMDPDAPPEVQEAVACVVMALTQWLGVPGAIEWVRRHAGEDTRAAVESATSGGRRP